MYKSANKIRKIAIYKLNRICYCTYLKGVHPKMQYWSSANSFNEIKRKTKHDLRSVFGGKKCVRGGNRSAAMCC